MATVICPKCTQQLGTNGIPPGTLVQCPCGAQLQTPVLPNPSPQPIPVDPLRPHLGSNPDPLFATAPPDQNGLGTSAPANQPGLHPIAQPVPQPNFPQHPTAGTQYPSAAPFEQSNQADSSSSNQKMTTKKALTFVNYGIRTVFFGVVAQICAALMGLMHFVPLFMAISSLAAIGGKIAIIVGYSLSVMAPEKSDSRKYVITALAIIVFGGIASELMLLAFRVGSIDLAIQLITFLGILSFALPMFSVVLYLLFLKKVAEFTKQSAAAEEANRLAIILIGITGAQFVFGFPLSFISVPLILVGLVGLGFLVAYIVWLIQYLQFLETLEFRKRTKPRAQTKGGWSSYR